MVIQRKTKLNIEDLKAQIIPILQKHQVLRASIFGSVATGTANESSDLDLLVEFKGEKSLLDLVSLKLDLEEKTGRKADVLTYRSLHPLIRDKVLKQRIQLF